MAFDHRGGIAGDRDALDDVGIERALREELRLAGALRRGLEDFDEGLANDLPLALGP
jgi:hypothetical protein